MCDAMHVMASRQKDTRSPSVLDVVSQPGRILSRGQRLGRVTLSFSLFFFATAAKRCAVTFLARSADTRQGTGNGSFRPSPPGSFLFLLFFTSRTDGLNDNQTLFEKHDLVYFVG